MNGTISDAAYYSTVLTTSQVKTHYEAAIAPGPAGWTLYYKEINGNLSEFIYTKPSTSVDSTVPPTSL
jgi:hypothetical protein